MKDSTPTSTPNETAHTEQVLVLPGYLFFIEAIEVPVDLQAAEIADFAELSLEAIAPFPVEQLNWGYLYSPDAPQLLLYATHRDRLKNAGYTDLKSYTWVLPDFAALRGAYFPEDTVVSLESEVSLSLLFFEKGCNLPSSVHATPLGEDNSPEESLKALLASAAELTNSATPLRMQIASVVLSEQGLPTFRQESCEPERNDLEYGSWTTLTPTETQLWQTDVRPSDFKEAERSARRLGALLLRITGWAALFAIGLIAGELLLLGSQTWLETLNSKIESQRTAVLTIQDKQALMIKLEQVAQNELRPIDILRAANSMREAGNLWIEYDDVVIEGENHITIEGKAASISALNRYTQKLDSSDQFELLESPESLTRDGKTTFTVTLAYNHTAVDAPDAATIEAQNIQDTEEESPTDERAEIE